MQQQQQPQQDQLPPKRIQIGVPHKKQKVLSDENMLTKEGGLKKINAVKVYFDSKAIIGLSVYYKLADGDYLKASHNVPADKKLKKKKNEIQQRVFEIGPDDYLLEISGHIDKDKITRLTFTSYRGKIGNYGSDKGQPFIHRFQNFTTGPFNSGYRDYLEFLDIAILPVPQSFLAEFKPVLVNINVSNQTQRQEKQQKGQYKSADNNFNPNTAGSGGFKGIYVPQSQPGSVNNSGISGITQSQRGQVSMPTFNMPIAPPMNNNNNFQQQQQQFQAPPQQQYQAPPMYQNQPPQFQQQQKQQQQQPQFNNTNNVTKSNYPEF